MPELGLVRQWVLRQALAPESVEGSAWVWVMEGLPQVVEVLVSAWELMVEVSGVSGVSGMAQGLAPELGLWSG